MSDKSWLTKEKIWLGYRFHDGRVCFFDFQAPSVGRSALERLIVICLTSRRKKHPRNRCKIRPMGQKIPTLPRRTRQKPQSAAGVLRFLCFSLKKSVDKYPESMLKPPLLQKTHNSEGSLSYFSNCDFSGKSLPRKAIAHFRSSSLADWESFIQNNMGLYFSNFR